MDMIRWLATNKVVGAVWGLGILAMLLTWIFGGSNNKVEAPSAAVETKVVEATANVASKPAVAAVATAAAVTATAAAASTVQTAVGTTSEAVEESVPEVQAVVAEAADTDAKSESLEASTDGSEVSSEQANAAKDGSLADKSSDDLLMMAREAYWDNGLDQAASLYSELITREPTVIEHKGELGNVFWRQGFPKKAAELYADIAEPMIAEGNGERVSNMVGFIGLFFPERANNIRKQLDAQ